MKRFALSVAFTLVGLQACGGGGGTSAPIAAPSANATTSQPKTSVRFTIAIPKGHQSASFRRAQYVSTNTQSITIQQLTTSPPYSPVGSPVVVNVTPTSPGCSSNTIQTTCTLTFPAAPGTFTFSIQSNAGLNATGALLAENALSSTTIVAGVANALSVTLNGVIAGLTLPNSVSGTLNLPQNVVFSVQDATGATVIGTGTYDNGPLILTDTTGYVTVSPSSFTAPSAASTFSLQCNTGGNGSIQFADSSGPIASLSYSCSGNTISLSPGSLDFEALAANPSDSTYDQIVTVTDANNNVVSQSAQLTCAPGPGNVVGIVAQAILDATNIWAIRPIDVGTCTFFVEDQFSNGGSESSQIITIETHTTSYTVNSHARR